MGVHDGHRGRLKRRFAEHGLDNFDDVNVLELLLFYVRPRQDTNVIAHALLEYFGSLDRVLEADIADLERVSGVGHETAVYLHLIPQVSRRYMMRKSAPGERLDSTEAAGKYLVPLFMHERDEVVYMLCLDSQCGLINRRLMARGAANSAEVSTRQIVEFALSQNASKVILAHNHPNGVALPSREDEQTTARLLSALAAVEVELVDHIVVAGGDYVSFAESGLLRLGERR